MSVLWLSHSVNRGSLVPDSTRKSFPESLLNVVAADTVIHVFRITFERGGDHGYIRTSNLYAICWQNGRSN